MVGAEGMQLSLSSSDLLVIAGEVAAAGGLFAMLGASVGFICRSPAPAMIVVFGGFIVEKIVGGFIGGAADYLPFALLNSALDIDATIARRQRRWHWRALRRRWQPAPPCCSAGATCSRRTSRTGAQRSGPDRRDHVSGYAGSFVAPASSSSSTASSVPSSVSCTRRSRKWRNFRISSS